MSSVYQLAIFNHSFKKKIEQKMWGKSLLLLLPKKKIKKLSNKKY